jgi:L-asparaginase/Glu-tRNA(Gln) amidotransferase subunit D
MVNPYPIIIIIGRQQNAASPNADGIANLYDVP